MRNLESQLQTACVTWIRMQHPKECCFSVPNGAKRSIITASILKREGAMSGVADLFLMKANKDYNGLFIEMKKDTKAKQSPSQKEFQKICIDKGYAYIVISSLDDFRELIKNYLEN